MVALVPHKHEGRFLCGSAIESMLEIRCSGELAPERVERITGIPLSPRRACRRAADHHSQCVFEADPAGAAEIDPEEVARVKAFVSRLAERALAMEGTCTGEHGVGDGKKKYLVDELGAPAVDLFVAIKKAVDPLNVMNPGKIV